MVGVWTAEVWAPPLPRSFHPRSSATKNKSTRGATAGVADVVEDTKLLQSSRLAIKRTHSPRMATAVRDPTVCGLCADSNRAAGRLLDTTRRKIKKGEGVQRGGLGGGGTIQWSHASVVSAHFRFTINVTSCSMASMLRGGIKLLRAGVAGTAVTGESPRINLCPGIDAL